MGTKGKHWEVLHRQRYLTILTREVLTDATVRRISDHKLAVELGVPVTAVQWYRHKYHIASARSDASVASMRSLTITPEQLGLIVGTLLGDGNLSMMKGQAAFLTICHGAEQREYVEHKRKLLDNLCLMPVSEKVTTGYNAGGICYVFSTILHPDLTKLWHLAYGSGKKTVTKELLSLLTIAGFAWWFFDDGSLNRDKHQYTLSTCAYSLAEQKLIREYLFKKLKLYSTICTSKNKEGKVYYHLYFPARSRDLLTAYLKPFAIPCMEYKIDRSSETIRETPNKVMI